MSSQLEQLGFDQWFRDKIDTTMDNTLQIARVISVNKNSYVISEGISDCFAELTGKFAFNSESPLDLPTVGDWVYVQYFDDNSFAVIHAILPRKSLLKRKTSGKKVEYQLIAANIDTAAIMQSLDNNFNIRRLERYLVMINEGGINPVVLLSKKDLVSEEELQSKIDEIHQIIPGIQIIAFSNLYSDDSGGLINNLFESKKTYCLLGSSGVGKTTLLNNLLHQDLYKTQSIRAKDGRGKHTTTRRELIVLGNGAMLIDTPGMRELGVVGVESGLDDTFSEITELIEKCRFNDCKHTNEKGCAILKALEEGTISPERYKNYMKLYKESLYHEMSYYERRQKDKSFGKYIHSVLKYKKDK